MSRYRHTKNSTTNKLKGKIKANYFKAPVSFFVDLISSYLTGNTPPPPRPVRSWGSWGQWSACSVTCGSGIQVRSRLCVPPLNATNVTTTPDSCSGRETDLQEGTCSQGSCPNGKKGSIKRGVEIEHGSLFTIPTYQC